MIKDTYSNKGNNRLQIDTIQIIFSKSYVSKYKFTDFIPKIVDGGKVIWEYKGQFGLNYVKIDDNAGKCMMKFSSKVLGANYPDMITIDTIRECLKNIVGSEVIVFDVDMVIKTADVLLCHVAKHLRLSKPLPEYVRLLKLLNINTNYLLTDYLSGITFLRRCKSSKSKEYFKIYDKELEYMLRKNSSFRDSLSKEEKNEHLRYYQNCTKVECELMNQKKIRQYLNIPKTINITLENVLTSSENPILKMFNKIHTPIIKDTSLRNTVNEDKEQAFIKELTQKESLIFTSAAFYQYDLGRIRYGLAERFKRAASVSENMKQYKSIVQRWKIFESDISSDSIGLIEQLREAMIYENKPAIQSPIVKETSLRKSVNPVDNLTSEQRQGLLENIKSLELEDFFDMTTLRVKERDDDDIPF
ncbi:hypothetical protein HER32_17515 [Hymenobacter sp. BT18]|uniref:hypothetical protein n=1 Tax=Hymenobacter sp. BT18 TaxID=2835648 RepID=UPI00143E7CA6|nr:hypothetical protein [Hymenobacter sp. BT18]QIX62874.1 hypothetical protein HER32_17515 [Hymenobacter sp. BT18]